MEIELSKRRELYKLFLQQYIDCTHYFVCDIFTDYFAENINKFGKRIYREDIYLYFPETELFLMNEENKMLQFGPCEEWIDEPKTMGIIFLQLCIEMCEE